METRSAPAQPFAAGLGADAASLLLQLEVEQLLYLEARLLDDWSLDAWLALFGGPRRSTSTGISAKARNPCYQRACRPSRKGVRGACRNDDAVRLGTGHRPQSGRTATAAAVGGTID